MLDENRLQAQRGYRLHEDEPRSRFKDSSQFLRLARDLQKDRRDRCEQVIDRSTNSCGAWLAGRQNLISVVRGLQYIREPKPFLGKLAAFGNFGGLADRLSYLLLSRRPLDRRMEGREHLENDGREVHHEA